MTDSVTSSETKLLASVRVLDIADFLPAEYAGRILADLGADVVKLEPAPNGVGLRLSGAGHPHLGHLFAYANAGKHSLCMNMQKRDAGLIADLSRWADVVIDGSWGNAEDGLSPLLGEIVSQNPALIVCSVTPFGSHVESGMQLGSLVAADAIIQALAGTAFVTGEPDGPPRLNGSGMTHTTVGVHACIAILHALLYRRRTGQGQRIDLAMFDTAIAMDAEHAPIVATERGRYQARRTGHYGDVDTLAVYQARDGYVVIEVWGEGSQSVWSRLATAIDRVDLIDDPRFRDDQVRMANSEELHSIIGKWIYSRPTAAAAVRDLLASNVVCGELLLPWQTIQHPHVQFRQVIRTLDSDPTSSLAVAAPQKFSSADVRIGSVPGLGEHNEDVLIGRLGHGRSRLDELVRNGVLQPAPGVGGT